MSVLTIGGEDDFDEGLVSDVGGRVYQLQHVRRAVIMTEEQYALR